MKPRFLAPPAAALCYPSLLQAFHTCVVKPGPWFFVASALLLALATAVPVPGIYVYWKSAHLEPPAVVEVGARRLALLSVAAAPLYTAVGVLLTIAHESGAELLVWGGLWVLATALASRGGLDRSARAQAASRPVSSGLRIAHGASAAAILLVFLALHLTNHLSGLWSEAMYRSLMGRFEHIYRATLVEPTLVALLLFQIASGAALLWQHTRRSTDFFRTLQLSAGAYLLFFLLAHMNSVFIYARAIAGIPTDWDFATGAPTGLLRDAWSIRLLPHYLLAVFFVLTHLILGARVVALAHRMNVRAANRLALAGISLAGAIAGAIALGLAGIHIR
jgi:hypothetical protein